MTALMYSFAVRKYDFTEELIQSGRANVRAKNLEGVNALMLALKTINYDEDLRYKLVNMLVDAGVNADEDLEKLDHKEDYRRLMETMRHTAKEEL